MTNKNFKLPTYKELAREFAPELLNEKDRVPSFEESFKEFMNEFETLNDIIPPIIEKYLEFMIVFNFGIDIYREIHYNTISKQLNKLITNGIKRYGTIYEYDMFIGGTIFADKLTPFWNDFPSSKSIDDNPFDNNLLKRGKTNDKLTLCEKIILLVRQAHDVIEKTKKYDQDRAYGVGGNIIIITDRINDLNILGNRQIYSIMDTFIPTDKYGRRSINIILAYILTEDGVNAKTCQIAKEIGIELVDFYDWSGLYGQYNDKWYWLDSMAMFGLFEHDMSRLR